MPISTVTRPRRRVCNRTITTPTPVPAAARPPTAYRRAREAVRRFSRAERRVFLEILGVV